MFTIELGFNDMELEDDALFLLRKRLFLLKHITLKNEYKEDTP